MAVLKLIFTGFKPLLDIVWWGRWSSDRRSSIRLSSRAFLLVSPRVFGHQTSDKTLDKTSPSVPSDEDHLLSDSQIAIVTRLHISVSCTLCLVHPPSLPYWRSRCDSSGACTACCGRVTWLS